MHKTTIGIIGYGFVGKATAMAFTNDEVDIMVVDPALTESCTIEQLVDAPCDVIFICVPTPTIDGKIDASLVLSYVERLKEYTGLLVVKSTVVPSIVKEIIQTRPKTIICPEFLREKNAVEDALHPRFIIVGSLRALELHAFRRLLAKSRITLTKRDGSSRIIHVTPASAAYIKYFINSYLATKVVFMHQFARAMDANGDSDCWEELLHAAFEETRLGCSHIDAPGEHGWGFAGSCLPKDTEALAADVEGLHLLDEVIRLNRILRDCN